jgi:hypothetical protein
MTRLHEKSVACTKNRAAGTFIVQSPRWVRGCRLWRYRIARASRSATARGSSGDSGVIVGAA